MIVFFGTSPRSAKFLEQAIKNGLKVDLVVSAPPKPIGKKQILTENPVVTLSKELNLSFIENLSKLEIVIPSEGKSDFPEAEESLSPHTKKEIPPRPRCNIGIGRDDTTLGLILDYNKIIPSEIIALFPKGIINIHFSKLPKYKGPAPIQYTILNGDKEAWITYYLINEKVDAGKIIKQTSLKLDLTENTEDLYQKLITKAASEINQIINDYLLGLMRPMSPIGPSIQTHKLTTENCKIDWNKPPQEIDHLIRASYPEPTAWTTVEFKVQSSKCKVMRLKVLKAHLESDKLILDQVQLEGKNPVSWKQFQQGYPEAKLN